jgi:hypothetical protein
MTSTSAADALRTLRGSIDLEFAAVIRSFNGIWLTACRSAAALFQRSAGGVLGADGGCERQSIAKRVFHRHVP